MAGYPIDVEQYIKSKVSTGEFSSEDAFICEATRVYREIESRYQHLKLDVQAAIDEVRAGHTQPLDIEAIQQELSNEIDERGMPS